MYFGGLQGNYNCFISMSQIVQKVTYINVITGVLIRYNHIATHLLSILIDNIDM